MLRCDGVKFTGFRQAGSVGYWPGCIGLILNKLTGLSIIPVHVTAS